MPERQARRDADDRELYAATEQAIQDATITMSSDPVQGLRDLVTALCRRHRVTIEWTEGHAAPGEAVAFANWRNRTITTPRIVTIEDGAVALHEVGHVLQGACPRTEPHRRDPTVARWWHCVACEEDAWVRALRLVPFTPAMQRVLAESLRRYQGTPASRDAKQRAQRAINGIAWRESLQRRVAHERRLELHAEMTQFVQEMKHAQ
jgi:hypothetical protein